MWLDAANPDRLVLSRRMPAGCIIFGLPLLIFGLFVVTGELPWFGAALCLFGTALIFGHRWVILDRKEGVLIDGVGVEAMFWSRRRPLPEFRRVLIHKTVVTGQKGHTTTYVDVSLGPQKDRIRVARARYWESAVTEAEKVAGFLRVPIEDEVLEATRTVEEINASLRERLGDRPVEVPVPPDSHRATALQEPDGVLLIHVPTPRNHKYLVIVCIVLIFWTLPVSFIANVAVGVFPVLLFLPLWIKTAFGYSADVTVDARGVTVASRGLIFGRTVRFPVAELEDLAILPNSHNDVVRDVYDVALVARSDRKAARFGYGLPVEELRWVRGLILSRLALAELPAHRLPPAEPPRRRVPVFAFAGAAVGAVVAALVGGPLDACVAAPFMEHFLNVGALAGATVGFGIDFAHGRTGLGRWAVLLGAALLVAAGGALLPGVNADPFWNEEAMWAWAPASRPWIFWAGWLPVGAAISVLGTLAVGLNAAVGVQLLRRPRL